MTLFLPVALAAAAVLGISPPTAAEEPSRILNTLEVQRLVAEETMAADLRLAAHFNAVADRYRKEAEEQRAIARLYRAAANRTSMTTAAAHAERRAAAAAEWAIAARALAGYHLDLADGRNPVVPARAAELHAGHGALEPTKSDLRKLELTAWTRAEHLALYEYFLTVARNKTAEAETWLQLATGYRAGVHKGLYDAAVPWEWQAQAARREAKTANESAQRHRQLATITVAANVVP